jgi:hypothetical protein
MADRQFPPYMQKKTFVRTGEGQIASYNWTDVADGSGYVDFYGFGLTETTNKYYALSSKVIVPGSIYYAVAATSGNHGTDTRSFGGSTQTMNFPASPFNTPRILKGKVIVEAGARRSKNTANVGSVGIKAVITIEKISGAVTTTIVSGETEHFDLTTANSTQYRQWTLVLDAPQTSFKIGDQLNVKVAFTTNSGVGSDGVGYFFHDPTGKQESANVNSVFKVSIPFKIEE